MFLIQQLKASLAVRVCGAGFAAAALVSCTTIARDPQCSRMPASGACRQAVVVRPTPPRLIERASSAIKELWANVSPTGAARGAVIAARSKHKPNYYYVWTRDAAIVMNEVVELFLKSRDQGEAGKYERALKEYVDFTKKNQETLVKGDLGEPKFEVDGRAFNEEWGRPQNDGPALRALTLMRIAKALNERGQGKYVRDMLYDGKHEFNSSTVITRDLDYVLHRWRDKDFDAWEEVKGWHFFTRMMQLQAMRAGAEFAKEMGDAQGAAAYTAEASEIGKALGRHITKDGYITATIERETGVGLDYKHSGLDLLSVMAPLRIYGPDIAFRPSDHRVLGTAFRLIERFREIYPINGKQDPVAAIGRYPEDKYYEGNPWVIGSYTFAELYFRVATEFKASGAVEIRAESEGFFKNLLSAHAEKNAIAPGKKFERGEAVYELVVSELIAQGERFMDTPIELPARHGHGPAESPEQFDKSSGAKVGADYLTWNFAAYLAALRARESLNND
ncbi:MAG TPA: glycoside hydrolase family 15 protein [Bdellovibrionales bacterium]|nr:glycoside hydrolase family 15 protein [Bdellovibrionales bacterium]